MRYTYIAILLIFTLASCSTESNIVEPNKIKSKFDTENIISIVSTSIQGRQTNTIKISGQFSKDGNSLSTIDAFKLNNHSIPLLKK